MRGIALLAAVSLATAACFAHAEDYLDQQQFLALAFGNAQPELRTFWFDETLRRQAAQAVGWAPPALRLRYWMLGQRTAWILEEIGKERPITFGVVIEQGTIADLRVLSFRESRGGEIRYPSFTAQYRGAALTPDGALSQSVDGITGATLSVRAANRVARMALWLHAQVVRNAPP